MADSRSRSGMGYADETILQFVDRVHASNTACEERAFTAAERWAIPAIQLSVSEAKLLGLVARMIGARRVVEVGTLAGYSALRLAAGMPPDGVLWTCESDARHAAIARAHIAAAAVPQRIEVLEGDASASLCLVAGEGPFDMVFLDGDKASYAEHGRWALEHLRSGGVLVADNAYLFGNLLQDTPVASSMRAFHEETARNFHSTCVPTPDGLVIAIKP